MRTMDLEIVDGKVKAIKIKRNEKTITKKDKDGKDITIHIDGGEVKHSYFTEVKADRTHKQEKPPKPIKETKKTTPKKNTKKAPTKKATSKKDTKKTIKKATPKKDTKKPTKKTSTKKANK